MVEGVRRFVLRELEPISQQVDDEDRIPDEITQKMREMGLFGLAIPKEYGGLGVSTLGECLINEELSKTNGCFRTRVASNNGLCAMGILAEGTPEQKKYYLPRLASGEMLGCFALSEPEAGSDANNVQTTAELKNGYWVLNGTKHFVSNGDIADLVMVFAVTDKKKRASSGITTFLVEKTFPGFYLGTIERKMGVRGSHTCQIIFHNCEVPNENVVGGDDQINKGIKIFRKTLDKSRLSISSAALGSAQRLLELSVAYAKQRVQFGKPIISFQSVQNMLADMATEIYAARQMLHHAAWLRDQRGKAIIKETAMVKLFCTEMACRVADHAVQIHGAMGYVKGYPVERFYRDVRMMRIHQGTSEIQRMVISRELARETD